MTIYSHILDYLRLYDEPVPGGNIERDCSQNHKPSTISRRLRELENSKEIKVFYKKVPGCKNLVVFYKIKKTNKKNDRKVKV